MAQPVIPKISKTVIAEFIVEFNKTDFKKLDYSKYNVVDFIGFDAFEVVRSLLSKQEDLKITKDELKQDIMWMLAITLKKGSVTKNNKEKMSKEGKAEVDRLIAKYDMRMTTGKGSSPGLVTFTRVLSAFPIAALNMLVQIGPRSVPAGPFGSSVIPGFMQHQVFASSIPRLASQSVITFVKTLVLAYSCDVSSIAKTTGAGVIKTEELLKIASQQITFVNAAFFAAYPSEASRVAFSKELEWKSIFNKKTQVLYESMKTTYFKDLPDLDYVTLDVEGRAMYVGVLEEEPLP
jgi:hypothetical protein